MSSVYGHKRHMGKTIKLNPSLCSKKWTFIKAGIDDFRDRFPPQLTDFIVRRKPGPEPVLRGLPRDRSQKKQQNAQRNYDITDKLTRQEVFFSRKIPAAERRRARIKELEKTLLEHPLMLLPGLEDGLAPELYDEVIDILDPGLLDTIANADLESLDSNYSTDNQIVPLNEYSDEDEIDYQGFDTHNKRANCKTIDEKHEKKIKLLSRDFCKWSETLGPSGPKLEQETIEMLFAPSYNKHKSTGAVQVVQLGTIPPELRAKAGLQPVPPDPQAKLDDIHNTKQRAKFYRFGAWYLKPSSWRRMEKNEPLIDEEKVRKANNLQRKKRNDAMLEELASLHGTHAFRRFLLKTNRKKPDFMREVAKIQDRHL